MRKPTEKITFTPDQEACIDTLASVFGGRHHLPRNIEQWGDGIAINHSGDIATYDFNKLTALVIAAHRDAVRIEIASSGTRMIKIMAHKRKHGERKAMPMWEYHPNLADLQQQAEEAK